MDIASIACAGTDHGRRADPLTMTTGMPDDQQRRAQRRWHTLLMRSVQVFPSMGAEQLSALLDALGERAGSEWFGIADATIEVTLTDHGSAEALVRALEDEGSWSATEIDEMEAVRGELGGCAVEVRVSGRVDGQAQVLDVVQLLLGAGGYASDDYSEKLWSLEEINQGRAALEQPGKPPGDLVMFLLSIVGVIVGTVAAILSAPAAWNDGTPGTFTAHGESCDRHSGCWWDGTFQSDDGQVWKDESMKSQELRQSGDEVRAQRVNGEVFRMGSKAWVVFSIPAAACLAYVAWFIWARLRFRRRSAT